MAFDRVVEEDPEAIKTYFARLKVFPEGVPPKDIWNMDETGFQVGLGDTRKIVTARGGGRQNYLANKGARESLTVTEGINAVGGSIPPMLTLNGKTI